MPSLTIYRIRDILHGTLPDVLDDVVEPEVLSACDVQTYEGEDLTARLYAPAAHPNPPKWVQFLESAFPDAGIGQVISQRALLVLAVRRRNRDRLFAIAFGQARHLIKSDFLEEAFGRRVALNLLYEPQPPGASSSYERVRQVDGRTIEANVRRARVQRSRDTSFEAFGVDPERDLLDRIVGVPPDAARFGARISGGTSIHVDVDLTFDELGRLLRDLLAVHERTTYRTHFAWVDKVRPVRDSTLLSKLQDHVAEMIREGEHDLGLAPPEIVDWDRVSTFTFELGERAEHTDLSIMDYVNAVDHSRSQIDWRRLASQRVSARDGDGGLISKWAVAKCLFGEIDYLGNRFVIDEGRFYTVDEEYLAELNAYVAAVPAPLLLLPATTATMNEGPYNELVASAADRLLLDKKNVWPAQGTTPIEICDVLTATGELVHVKRKLGSSDLSHMFGQGFVSAEVIHAGPELRAIVRARVQAECEAQGKAANDFTSLFGEPFAANALTVVYAVLADWQGASAEERLPFFSKVNLRHHGRQLRRMGYGLAFASVEAPLDADEPG